MAAGYTEMSDNPLVKEASQQARLGFVRKVYGITGAQLLLTAAISTPVSINLDKMDPASVSTVLMFSSVMTLVTMFSLVCCPEMARKVPQNYILLFIFTAFEGVLVGAVCSTYSTQAVVAALLATSIVVIGLTLYAWNTKSDFTGCGPYLVAMLLALIGCQLVIWLVCMFGSCPPEVQKLYAPGPGSLHSGVHPVLHVSCSFSSWSSSSACCAPLTYPLPAAAPPYPCPSTPDYHDQLAVWGPFRT
ncbi:unnamed protein product [Prorocentrum cordatum]|uniref:Uncharacterized protein n=1 Tax=Prorocentrum cordatum TaxID=2364126 RepID=A0ABN9UW13_9DINO|nr:unnamed protein product [Polarella glacialis]